MQEVTAINARFYSSCEFTPVGKILTLFVIVQNFSINYWIEQGADRKKIVMGMPMYGQSFSLADNNNRGLNAPTYGGGEAGDSTRARGFLSYYEVS